MNRITPFVKRMRANGGTIYTFTSALEDIGLNINERNNVVKISNFALLNIPNIAEPDIGTYDKNFFNVRNIPGAFNYDYDSPHIKDGRVLIAESFQNYALNLEVNLLNQSTYNPELSTTVSERVFWKWIKETGAIRWDDPSIAGTGIRYWKEEINQEAGYQGIVKYIGQVSAGNIRVDSFGTYNETYVLVPTSHGQTRVYFKQYEDDNYYHGLEIGNLHQRILGREAYTKPHPDALNFYGYYDYLDSSLSIAGNDLEYYNGADWVPGWWYSADDRNPAYNNSYLVDSSNYIDSGVYNVNLRYDNSNPNFRRSNVDCLGIEFNLNNLKELYGDPTLTYDKLATGEYQIDDDFEFNAVLIYYSVYNSTMEDLIATNLLGVMFLDAPEGNTSNLTPGTIGIQIPSIEKIASGPTGFGTSYSLRLNIKTDNMLDDTAAEVVDYSTSSQLWGEEWQTAFKNLEIATNTLTQQNAVTSYISNQYITLQGNQEQIFNRLVDLEQQVNSIDRSILGTPNTISMFSDGDDQLIDSSIFMRWGRIGLFTDTPQHDVDADGDVKTMDLFIEKTIRDASGNTLLEYGSPIQIGSTTYSRNVNIHSGDSTPGLIIDTSNNVHAAGDMFASSYTSTSDKRLKTNIQSIEDPLEKIMQLDGISYEDKFKGEKHFGLIAQDVEHIIPEIIQEQILPFDKDNKYKTIRYQELIPYLIECIKEQQKDINELKNEIKNLKEK